MGFLRWNWEVSLFWGGLKGPIPPSRALLAPTNGGAETELGHRPPAALLGLNWGGTTATSPRLIQPLCPASFPISPSSGGAWRGGRVLWHCHPHPEPRPLTTCSWRSQLHWGLWGEPLQSLVFTGLGDFAFSNHPNTKIHPAASALPPSPLDDIPKGVSFCRAPSPGIPGMFQTWKGSCHPPPCQQTSHSNQPPPKPQLARRPPTPSVRGAPPGPAIPQGSAGPFPAG